MCGATIIGMAGCALGIGALILIAVSYERPIRYLLEDSGIHELRYLSLEDGDLLFCRIPYNLPPKVAARWHFWPVPLLLLIASSFILQYCVRKNRQSRLRVKGKCVYCGYDMRANLMRCSECGKQVDIG